MESLSVSASNVGNIGGSLEQFDPRNGVSKDSSGDRMWKTVLDKLSEFSSALGKASLAGTELSDSIDKVITLVVEFVGDEYESLDCSKLDEIKQDRIQLNGELSSLRQQIRNLEKMESGSEEDVPIDYSRLYQLESQISELDKLIDKLEQLKIIEEKALKTLEEAYGKLQSVSQSISEIKPGHTMSYFPMQW